MKHTTIIICMAVSLMSISSAAQKKIVKPTSTQKKTKHTERENAFALSVIKALQSKDVTMWIALYPNNDEYKGILQTGLAVKAEGLTQQIIDDIIIRRKKEASAVYATQFAHYASFADSLGFSWQDAVFEKITFMEVYPEPVKLRYLDATIRFSSNRKHFIIDGVQAVDIASGYKLQALTGIRLADADE